MKHIIVDMDDIVVDFRQQLIEDYIKLTGHNVTKADITKWHFEDCMPNREAALLVLRNLDRESWWDDLRPVSLHAATYLYSWATKAEVTIVSAPWKDTGSAKFRWLRSHLTKLTYDSLSLITKKHHVHGDVIIDDKHTTLHKYRARWPDAKLATIKFPHHDNPEEQCPDGTFFAHDYASPDEAWRQLDEFVRSII